MDARNGQLTNINGYYVHRVFIINRYPSAVLKPTFNCFVHTSHIIAITMRFSITTVLFGALLFIVSVCITVTLAGPLKETAASSDGLLVATRNCQDLCGSCGCRGFYCGAECLCECDADGDDEPLADGRCIERMQERCEREQLPYEVLIQGSNGNRLVRSLFVDVAAQQDGNCVANNAPLEREKRSTFSIYKPAEQQRIAGEEEEVEENAEEMGSDEQRNFEDNAATLREVQSFLSEIGEELAQELTQRGRDLLGMMGNYMAWTCIYYFIQFHR